MSPLRPQRCSFAVAAFLLFAASSCAHNLPLSYVDLRISENGVDATIETSAKNLARELPEATEEMLLANAPAQKDLLLAAVRAGLTITANEEALSAELLEAEPLLARRTCGSGSRFRGSKGRRQSPYAAACSLPIRVTRLS